MQLVGRPQVPLEHTGHSRDHDHRHLRLRGVQLPARMGPDELALQEHLHRGPKSHTMKMGGELRRMYGSAVNTTNYIPAYQFFSIHNFAVDTARQMNRYVDPRSGQPATAYSMLIQTEWALFWNDDWRRQRPADDQRRRAVRELRHLRGPGRDAPEPDHGVRQHGRRAPRLGPGGRRRQVLRARQQQLRTAPRIRVGSEG